MSLYRYRFPSDTNLDDVEVCLLLAIWGAESLHGETCVRREAAHRFDRDRRVCVINASAPAGRTLNRLFGGYLRKELGEAFSMDWCERTIAPTISHASFP